MKGMVGAFGRGMQNRVNSFNLANMSANIRSLTEDSGNLSNSMESIGASYAQQARPALALMGVTGKELQRLTGQASGMAYGLNVSVETVTKTMGTLRTASAGTKSVFDALGMSTADFVKLAEGTGVATEQIGAAAGLMTDQWHMGAQQAKQMLEYSVAMGQKGGVGGLMYSGLSDQVTTINNMLSFQVASHQRSADELDRMLKSSVRLAGAYKQLGFSAEESAKSASETSSKFLEWQIEMERFQAGEAGAALPQIITDLSALGMGTDEAMSLLQLGASDSAAAMLKLSQYMQAASKSGKNIDTATLANLQATLGGVNTNIISLAMSGDKSTQVLEAMSNATVKTDGALKQLSKDAYSSGRTLQESLDMAKEAFMTRVRAITRPEVRGYVKEEIQSYKELGKQAKELASDDIWGPMVKAYSIFDQMGAKGVILQIGKQMGMDTKKANKYAIGIDLAIGAIGKMQQTIAPVMETLGMGGMTGIVGGIAGWFMMPKDARDKVWKQIKQMFDEISPRVVKIWNEDVWPGLTDGWHTFSSWFTGTAWPVISKAATDFFEYLFKDGGPVDQGIAKLKEWLGKMWDGAGIGGKAMMVGVIGVLINKVTGVGALIGGVVSGALSAAFRGIGALAADSPGIIGLAAVIAGVGVVAIKAWFDYLNKGLDEQIAKGTKKIDEQYAMVKGLQEQTKIDRQNLKEDFGQTGTGGDVSKMDKSLKDALIHQRDYAGEVGRLRGSTRVSGVSGQRIDMPAMASTFSKVQGIPAFQIQAAEIEKKAAAKQKAGEFGDASFAPWQVQERKDQFRYEQLDTLRKAWSTKIQADIDQMMIQASNLQQRLAEVYGVSVKGPSEELIGKASAAGVEIITQVGAGVTKATPQMTKAVGDALWTGIGANLPQSPVASGPLKDPFLPAAGTNVLVQILNGIQGAQTGFQSGFAKVLEDSAMFAIKAFQQKALDQFNASPINQEIFGKITAQYSGVLSEDDKKLLKSSLDMSGLYGVINAVILDGVETRKVLTSIADNTAGLKGWTPGAGSGWSVYQGNGAARPQPQQ